MRRLLLTTASLIALGLVTPAFAQSNQTNTSPSMSSQGTMSPPSSGSLPNGAKMPTDKARSSSSMNSTSSSGSSMDAKSTNTASGDMHSMKSTSHKHAAASNHTKEAQTALKAQGLYTGHIDGKNGPMTKSAIAQFQHKQGLKESGMLDSETRSKLMASNGAGGTSSSTMNSNSSMNSGSMSSSAPIKSLPSSGSLPNGAKMPTDRAATSTRGNGG